MKKTVLFWQDVETAFSIFIKKSRNAMPKYEHIIAPRVSSISTFIPELYNSVVLISLNVMWNIRNEADKTFVKTK